LTFYAIVLEVDVIRVTPEVVCVEQPKTHTYTLPLRFLTIKRPARFRHGHSHFPTDRFNNVY